MLRAPHLKLTAVHFAKHSLRGGAGLIAIFLTLIIGLVCAAAVIAPLETADRVASQMHARGHDVSDAEVAEMSEQARAEMLRVGTSVIQWATDTSDAQVEYWLQEKPALVSAMLVLLMLFTPLFSCLAGFNQTSGDIGSKGLRYLLIRTERENIFVGRLIGAIIFNAVVLAILFLILALYVAVKIKMYPTGTSLAWLAGGYVRVLIFSLPYVAMCAWISGMIDSPFGSLTVAWLIAYIWPLLVRIGSMSTAQFKYANYLTPWGYKWWLFSENPGMVAAGTAVMLAFAALFLWIGLRMFKKRDL